MQTQSRCHAHRARKQRRPAKEIARAQHTGRQKSRRWFRHRVARRAYQELASRRVQRHDQRGSGLRRLGRMIPHRQQTSPCGAYSPTGRKAAEWAPRTPRSRQRAAPHLKRVPVYRTTARGELVHVVVIGYPESSVHQQQRRLRWPRRPRRCGHRSHSRTHISRDSSGSSSGSGGASGQNHRRRQKQQQQQQQAQQQRRCPEQPPWTSTITDTCKRCAQSARPRRSSAENDGAAAAARR